MNPCACTACNQPSYMSPRPTAIATQIFAQNAEYLAREDVQIIGVMTQTGALVVTDAKNTDPTVI